MSGHPPRMAPGWLGRLQKQYTDRVASPEAQSASDIAATLCVTPQTGRRIAEKNVAAGIWEKATVKRGRFWMDVYWPKQGT